jgi:23S rRNA maturation mini-RNase III
MRNHPIPNVGINPQNIPNEVRDFFENLVAEVIETPDIKIYELVNDFYLYAANINQLESYNSLKKKDKIFKKQLILYGMYIIQLYGIYIIQQWNVGYSAGDDKKYDALHPEATNIKRNIAKKLNITLLQSSCGHTFEELMELIDLAIIKYPDNLKNLNNWFPLESIIKQVEKIAKKDGLTSAQQTQLQNILTFSKTWSDQVNEKISLKVNEILAQTQGKSIGEIEPILLDDEDEIGKQINAQIATFDHNQKLAYYQFLALLKKSTQGKPPSKFHPEVTKIIQSIGQEHFIQTIKQWLEDIKKVNPIVEHYTQTYNNTLTGQPYDYSYTTHKYLKESNLIFIKGLVWSVEPYSDKDLMQLLAEFAEKCYKKIPGKGPLAMSIGNACIYVLSRLGLEGVSYLSRLKLRIRQANTQTLIENYIRTAAEALGVTPAEIEDMATPSFGLENGKLEEDFEGYKAVISIESIGKTQLAWFKPDGTPMKSVPSVVNENHKDSLKELKNDHAEIKKTLTIQRDRLERSFMHDRTWTWEAFNNYYFSHGLMSFLTRKLIWIFEIDQKNVEVFYLNNQWVNLQEQPIDTNKVSKVKLWHPVFSQTQEVMAWREFLARHEIQQPLKQAYREIYLLTDAEINTRNYSNRMAAHILKQHQFNSLAKIRGWKYSLLGAYDKGYDTEIANIQLPNNYKAEFWVQEVDANEEWNDTGIYNYVSTDQVRFYRNETQLNMIDVPPLLFSETMRDVDLFVGVASVGNDPNWRDGGLQDYRNYWESYSFGDLTEVAKTRKQVLEKLIPRLKIAKQCEITEKFLVVKGSLRTYKIHMGSGNILMEPNDQYLCIVVDRKAEDVGNKVFLPFEGDAVLSIIISKAMLLADDTKIKDTTITSQINR